MYRFSYSTRSICHNFIRLSYNRNETSRGIHLSPESYTYWFSKYKNSDKYRTQKKKPFIIQDDWEHEKNPTIPGDELIPALKNSPLLDSITNEVALKLSSLDFAEKNSYQEAVTNALFEKLNLHPTDSSTVGQIVRLTVEIRHHKNELEGHNYKKRTKTICSVAIQKRKELLKQLQSENRVAFDWLCKELSIALQHTSQFEKLNDRKIFPENFFRKKEFSQKCYQERKEKKEAFKNALEVEKEKFFQEKHVELDRLRSELKKVNGRDIETLMQEVIDERKDELLQPIRDDRIAWWHREKALNVEVMRKMNEKAEKARLAQRK